MNDQKPDKDPNKLSEEELKVLFEQIKKQKKANKNLSVALGFMLHKNYVIHLLLSLAINLLIFAVVLGLAIGIDAPLVDMTVTGFIFAVILLTLIENFVKILLFKYITRIMIFSMGLMSVMVQIIILYAIDLLLTEGFHFINLERLMIFSFAFSLLRLVISIYLRRFLYNEKIVFMGGKK
ncbi:MAG: hypothetical protein A2Y45_02730 [Tenericutes bacterium GWC2_34_14]|nr:MAG: hypothetical protein A2Z84_00560 [Tenericutes bacterium GWA2_35_7]OHE28151.1 MAG: hypothetical protein A2Y45_02730 [Tenericutes bacterium GWC2_34_14]OHE32909.1 MAG: hypothetical protein A2012_09500 [Tenericutes bacterium GWE2_34_108]OHE36126.1 MAG: hypothetical protein A2Y46_06910 [Tenericutes bacterium GWF1_35_14]OHE39349.1 MAG: hypothetical protein A2Y44_06270 [Tenericutes bacterium GWF2_35_184]OHE43831.1 MAG: hypothetical protein A3K26_09080 [Tenericutes bacterium RIFOXYA12_FULL_35_